LLSLSLLPCVLGNSKSGAFSPTSTANAVEIIPRAKTTQRAEIGHMFLNFIQYSSLVKVPNLLPLTTPSLFSYRLRRLVNDTPHLMKSDRLNTYQTGKGLI